MIRQAVYRLGVRYWNSRIPVAVDFLARSRDWSREELLRHQATRLRELLLHAREESPYYREVMAARSVDPTAPDIFAELRRMPLLEKETLLANLSVIQNRISGEKHFHSETSGSTGRPLVYCRNAEWDAWHRASVLRGYAWYGVSPWDRSGYLWGYNFSPAKRARVRLLDYLQNRFRMFSYKPEEMDRFLDRLRGARVLAGYSSMIYELARRKNEACPARRYDLRMIKGTSEKIYDHYQDQVVAAFGRRMVSEYGSAECGIISFESPCGRMHVNMETVIVEEHEGEIIVTNLLSKSMPIIRYRLGDYVSIADEGPCNCGMDRPVITEILGRVGRTVYGKENRYPSLVLYYIFKNIALTGEGVLNYQAVQHRRGELILRIEERLTERQHGALQREIARYFGADMVTDVLEGERIMSEDRKRVDLVSTVDPTAVPR